MHIRRRGTQSKFEDDNSVSNNKAINSHRVLTVTSNAFRGVLLGKSPTTGPQAVTVRDHRGHHVDASNPLRFFSSAMPSTLEDGGIGVLSRMIRYS